MEWQFIDKGKYECEQWEKPYLLEYELAREAKALGSRYRSATTRGIVFGNRFPETAFLAIEPAERRTLLKTAFQPSDGGVPLFDFTTEWQGVSYQFNYHLKPEYQAEVEGTVTQARESENSEPAEHAINLAVDKFMGGLPAEAHDESIVHIRMTIDFDYSDDALKEAFTGMLTTLRRGKPKSGKKDEVNAHLKRLAATRAISHFWHGASSTEFSC